MNDVIVTTIKDTLEALEHEEGVAILLAVESGSRAWGFPSSDSDYDVRFVYARRPNWYLSIDLEEQRDVIERPLKDSVDLSGWDIRKALRLFRKSNPPLLEWLQCPIVYRERCSLATQLRALLPTPPNSRMNRVGAREAQGGGVTTRGPRLSRGGQEAAIVHLSGIPFESTDWQQLDATEHAGEVGMARWRTRQFGAVRVRLVEYPPGYRADHWCQKGHILFCVAGELETELADGRLFRLVAGMSYQVADNAEPHRSRTASGATLFIVD